MRPVHLLRQLTRIAGCRRLGTVTRNGRVAGRAAMADISRSAAIGFQEIGTAGDREGDLVFLRREIALCEVFAVRHWRDVLEKAAFILLAWR